MELEAKSLRSAEEQGTVSSDSFWSQTRKPGLERRHDGARVTLCLAASWGKYPAMPPTLLFHCTALIPRPASDRRTAGE